MQDIARRRGALRQLSQVAATVLLLWAVGRHPGVARAAATLTITPAISPCTGQVNVVGVGFAPGTRVGLVARATRPRSDSSIEFATQTVAADGTFRAALATGMIAPTCQMMAAETVYTIYAITPPIADKSGTGPEVTLATATLTVGAGTPGLPNTGAGGGRKAGVVFAAAALALGGVLVLVAGGAARA